MTRSKERQKISSRYGRYVDANQTQILTTLSRIFFTPISTPCVIVYPQACKDVTKRCQKQREERLIFILGDTSD